jgi:hypothetical protein
MVNPGYPYGYLIGHAGDRNAVIETAPQEDCDLRANLRIRGSRIYWSSNEDGHSELYCMFEMDWEKGVKSFGMGVNNEGEGDWAHWINKGSPSSYVAAPAIGDDNAFIRPPKIVTYRDLNGYGHDESITARWKTSAIVNGRVYIGNYERPHKTFFQTGSEYNGESYDNFEAIGYPQYNRDRGGTLYYPGSTGMHGQASMISTRRLFPDGLCKTPVGKYDTFPENEDHEITFMTASNDGDEIVHLESYSDKLLVFKSKKLIILDCTNDNERIEAEHAGMGLDGSCPSACCKTDFGIAWINTNGVFHYDGNKIESLSSGKIDSYIKNKRNTFPWRDDGLGHSGNKVIQWRQWAFAEDKAKPYHYANRSSGHNIGIQGKDGNIIKSIGFDPVSRKLICCKNIGGYSNGSTVGARATDMLVYSFEQDSWTMVPNGHPTYMTNFINYKGRLASFANTFFDSTYTANTTANSEYAHRLYTWTDDPSEVPKTGPHFCHTPHKTDYNAPLSDIAGNHGQNYPQNNWYNHYNAWTKDFTFGDPAARKKIYRVYVTYRCSWGPPNVEITYNVNGRGLWSSSSGAGNFDIEVTQRGTADGPVHGATSTTTSYVNRAFLPGPTTVTTSTLTGTGSIGGGGGWATAILTPTTPSECNNIYSFQLLIQQKNNSVAVTPSASSSVIPTSVPSNVGQGYVCSDFEINDITIVYKRKPLK